MPSIGKTSGFAQKGPTCWYYAAKMLLKFHQKLEKGENNKVYEQFKVLHEVRKVITDIGEGYESIAKLRVARKYHETRAWSVNEVEQVIKERQVLLSEIGLDLDEI